MRKPALPLLLALLLAACVPGGTDRLLRLGGLATGSTPGLAEAEMRALMRSDTDRMVLRIPARGVAVTLLKAGERDGVIRWRATDNVQIYTRNGMIIGTRGFGHDLMTGDPGPAAAMIAAGGSGQITRIHRVLNGEDRTEILSWVCDIAPAGTETVRTGDTTSVTALKVTEACHSPRGNFNNQHWVWGGAILQSWQMIEPEPDPGQIRLLFLP